MPSISTLILKQLDELLEDDFKRFKSHLKKDNVQDYDHIPRSKLEKAERLDVVELMVDQYRQEEAANITVQILKLIQKNELAIDLEKKLKGQVQAAEVDGASSSCSSSPATGVLQNISADQSSTVNAPCINGGNYNAPVTIITTTYSK